MKLKLLPKTKYQLEFYINRRLDLLTELVFKRLIERYGPIYPLNFGMDNEEILVSELALQH